MVTQKKTPSYVETSMTTHVLIMSSVIVNVSARTKIYDIVPKKETSGGNTEKYSTLDSTTPEVPLSIEKPTLDAVLHPPKSMIRKVTFNPNYWATQIYNIVEDLA